MHGGLRHIERRGGLSRCQPTEEPALYNPRLPRRNFGELSEGFIQRNDFLRRRFSHERLAEQFGSNAAATFLSVLCTRIIHKHVAHGLRRNAEQVASILKRHLGPVYNLEIGLVNQRRRVQGFGGTSMTRPPSQSSQFAIDRIEQR